MIKVTNFKLGIGIPHTWSHIPIQFFDSFIQMDRPDFEYIRDFGGTGQLDIVRNNIVEKAMSSNCSHLLMMDTDQIYPKHLIPKLLSHNCSVVGALIYRRYPPFDPLMFKGEINSYENITEWDEGELVEVDATGTGCLMFDMKIFYDMPKPWFQFRENPDKEKGGVVGEDIGFCSDLRKRGYKIFVDTSLPCGHLSTMEVNRGTWKMWEAIKKSKAKREQIKQKEAGHGY